jgi:hypothetical protein
MRVRIALSLVALVALAVGCKRAPPPDETTTTAPTSSASTHPNDRLAPDELLEGTDKAFGILMPRGTRIDAAFSDTVNATVSAKIAPVVSYFRARVREGTFMKGQFTATFEHVKVPGLPGRELRIRLNEIGGVGTKVELFDSTPPTLPDLPNDEARWKAVGMTPDGKLLDPKHLE